MYKRLPQQHTAAVTDGQVIAKSWIYKQKALEQYAAALEGQYFQAAADRIIYKALSYINEESGLTQYDEKIFDYYKDLMRYYYKTINLYQETRISLVDDKIKEILDGICVVLSSQLKQFEDSKTSEYSYSSDRNKNDAINPAKYEKENLIKETRFSCGIAVKSIRSRFHREHGGIISDIAVKSLARFEETGKSRDSFKRTLEEVFNYINPIVALMLYKSYVRVVRDCSKRINDLHVRKAAHFYYESINQEKENLSSIIKIQVVALEKEMINRNIQPDEQQMVQQILGTLREGYQYLGKEIMELVDYFKEAESSGKALSYMTEEEFSRYLYEGVVAAAATLTAGSYPKEIEDALIDWRMAQSAFDENLIAAVTSTINSEVVKYFKVKSLYSYKKMIMEKLMMTDELLQCFAEITKYFAMHRDSLMLSQNAEIMAGINETIEIKLDNLSDNKKTFSIMADNIVQSVNTGSDTAVTPEQLKLANKIAAERWHEAVRVHGISDEDALPLANSILAEISNIEFLAEYREKGNKIMQRNQESIEKKIMQYLRDQLLFEVSTFEEIVTYSVSRIKQSRDWRDMEYVMLIDRVTNKISQILKRYNIEQIMPVQGDMFNGKEHEVLMAEKHEGIEKGRIIKLMNSGYKYGNVVLIRANVIAAR